MPVDSPDIKPLPTSKRNPILDKDFGAADFKTTARKTTRVIKFVLSGKLFSDKSGKVTPEYIKQIWNQNFSDYGEFTMDEIQYLLQLGASEGFYAICTDVDGSIIYGITP